jgi:hypothetical protein
LAITRLSACPNPTYSPRLQAVGLSVSRTDLNGAVTFYLDGQSVTYSAPIKILFGEFLIRRTYG